MFKTTKRAYVAAFCLSVGVSLAGCNVEGRSSGSRVRQEGSGVAPPVKLAGAAGGVDISIVDAHEVDLVEAVVDHRTRYQQTLRQLHNYYESHGQVDKARWAAFELSGFRSVKQFRYLLDAEVPTITLKPSEQIQEADALFEQGRTLMRAGGHGVPGIYRQDRMIEAAELFRELIQRYPNSDKVDDAAFLCGEIHKNYLPGQEEIAVSWYERAWTWNPQTTYPARYQAAVVYDFRLHDRHRALELYRAAVEHEAAHKANALYATNRIQQLTTGTGDSTEPVRP